MSEEMNNAKEQFTRMLKNLQDGEIHVIPLKDSTEGGDDDEL